jgi:ABC-2 type transport system permease protein
MPVVMQYLPLAAAGGIGLTTTSAISLSMEGKNAWLMGTAPVSARTILASKGLLNLVITLPCCLITALLLWYHLQLSLIYTLACLLLPAAFAAFATVLGLASDVKMARYDWENEQQMVKSSMQVMLGLVTCFASLLIMAGTLYLAGTYSLLAAFALAGLLLAASALVFRQLARKPIYIIK